MKAKALTLAVLALLSTKVVAQNTMQITVPADGKYYYWLTYTDINGKQTATTPLAFEGKKTTADVPLVKDAVPKDCKLYLLNTKTGNEAVLPVKSSPGQPIKLSAKQSDFKYIRRVEVLVTSAKSGKPVASALVKLKDASQKVHMQVLDPSANGKAYFTDVESGTVEITAVCDESESTQKIKLSTDRESPVPIISIAVAGDIETSEASAPSLKKKPIPKPEVGFNFPIALVGILILIGIAYLAVLALRNRGARVRNLLKKLGVEIPEEPEPQSLQPPPPQPVDPTVCPFCGGKKTPLQEPVPAQ